jgi:hypothetical protein
MLLPRGVASSASVVTSPSVKLLPSLVLSPSVSELGVIITKHAPSGVASLPRLASSPEHGVVIAEHAPSGVALSPSSVALLPERGVIVIVAAIDDRATTKRYFVGVGSGSRGEWKREQVLLGR